MRAMERPAATRAESEGTCLVDIDDTLDQPEKVMSAPRARHAGVTSNGRLVGVLSAQALLAEIERSMERVRSGEEPPDGRTVKSLLEEARASRAA